MLVTTARDLREALCGENMIIKDRMRLASVYKGTNSLQTYMKELCRDTRHSYNSRGASRLD